MMFSHFCNYEVFASYMSEEYRELRVLVHVLPVCKEQKNSNTEPGSLRHTYITLYIYMYIYRKVLMNIFIISIRV